MPLKQCVEDGPMSKKTIFDYAKMAAQAEQRILELLDGALRDDFAAERSEKDLQTRAHPRRGQEPSG